MNKRLDDYLIDKGAKQLDKSVLKSYVKLMSEYVIPEANKKIRENERRAAEMRFSPRRRKEQKDGV